MGRENLGKTKTDSVTLSYRAPKCARKASVNVLNSVTNLQIRETLQPRNILIVLLDKVRGEERVVFY